MRDAKKLNFKRSICSLVATVMLVCMIIIPVMPAKAAGTGGICGDVNTSLDESVFYSNKKPVKQDLYEKYSKGVKEAPAEDFKYKDNVDGTITITRYTNKKNKGSFKIPSYIDGKKVTALGSGEEFDGVGLKGKVVIIPDTVETINYDALSGDFFGVEVETLLIGKNVKTIDDAIHSDVIMPGAFTIKQILVNPKNKTFYSENGALYEKTKDGNVLFSYPNGCKKAIFEIPDGVRFLKSGCFGETKYLDKIVIGKDVEEIAVNRYSVGEDYINYITNISCDSRINSVTCFEVAKGNKTFYAKDGVLFKRKGKILVDYPRGKKDKKYTMPEGTRRIGSRAFSENNYMTKIVLPDSLVQIDAIAFYSCDKLNAITIPKNVKKIQGAAFYFQKFKKIIVKSKDLRFVVNGESNKYAFGGGKRRVVYLYKGSTAEKYAKSEGLNYKYIK